MQTFYENVWSDYGCFGAGLSVTGISLALFALVLGGLWLVFRRAIRRAPVPERRRDRRGVLAILYGSGVVMILTLMVATLFDTTLHRAAFASDAILLDHCDSLTPRREVIPLNRVDHMDYAVIMRGSPSDAATDNLVIVLDDGSERIVPIDKDMPDAHLRTLRQLAPRSVFDAWRAEVIRRGQPVPERVFGE